MRRYFYFLLVAAAVATSMVFWAIFIALVAWALVFLTGALHGSGLAPIPALSFWQSMGVVFVMLSLLAIPLRAVRRGRRSRGR